MMRISQISVSCPTCDAPGAILSLTEYLTGERAGQHEFALTCPHGCNVGAAECLAIWAAKRSEPMH